MLISPNTTIIIINSYEENNRCVLQLMNLEVCVLPTIFILIDDVISCIMTGEIIEEYPNDYPYPSCLTLGNLNTKCPLHVVVGSNHEQLWIITAYYPSSDKWESDLKTRKEN